MRMLTVASSCLCSAALLLVVAGSVRAQDDGSADLLVGFSAGVDGIPAPLRGGCGSDLDLVRGEAAAIRVGTRLPGPFGLEVRGGLFSGTTIQCVNLTSSDDTSPRPLPPSVRTEYSTVEPGPQAFVDARLRLEFGETGATVVSFGPGMIEGGPSMVAGSVGHLWGSDRRLGFEVGITAFRMPWRSWEISIDPVPEDPGTVFVGDPREDEFTRWQVGFGIQGVLEVDVLSFGSR